MGMKEDTVIFWGISGPAVRESVCSLVGYTNRKGKLTPTGKRIAQTTWDKLSPAARNVLERHGIRP